MVKVDDIYICIERASSMFVNDIIQITQADRHYVAYIVLYQSEHVMWPGHEYVLRKSILTDTNPQYFEKLDEKDVLIYSIEFGVNLNHAGGIIQNAKLP